MRKLNLSKLLFDEHPAPEKVYEKLIEVFSCVCPMRTNELFFNMQFVCNNDEGQVKLIVKYGYRVKSERRPDVEERWFYNPVSPRDDK